MIFDFEALDFIGNTLLPKRWIFAKTMPKNSHWYTLRKDWNDDGLFDRVVETMRKTGYVEYFWKKPYTMININNMKYWTMGAPIQETILINRAKIIRNTEYDKIAYAYKDMFTDEESLKENQKLIALINYQGGSVLDIGCGEGLFLDYIKPDSYIGIDPAIKMLDIFVEKHPNVETMQTLLEEYVGEKADLVVSLFGSASYIHPLAVGRILDFVKDGGRYFIMFFKDDYLPVTYLKSGITMKHYKGNHLLLLGEISEFGNFWIVQGNK